MNENWMVLHVLMLERPNEVRRILSRSRPAGPAAAVVAARNRFARTRNALRMLFPAARRGLELRARRSIAVKNEGGGPEALRLPYFWSRGALLHAA